MKILIDICHPAHVHFFKHAIYDLQAKGCTVLITSREKDCAIPLLDALGFQHTPLKSHKGTKVSELVTRNYALYQFIKKNQPDVLTAIGGTFIAHAGFCARVPSIVFYDGDNATLQNSITYPFASMIVVPRCYRKRPPKHHIRYAGYHELAYLHPRYFTPDIQKFPILKPTLFIRHVANNANHDIGHRGLHFSLIEKIISTFDQYDVVLSSEGPVPTHLEQYVYRGKLHDIHHLLAQCHAYIGDSPTMASEAAVLGVPAIFASTHLCGNMQEQEYRYQLVQHTAGIFPEINDALTHILSIPRDVYKKRRDKLLSETLDVSQFITYCLRHHSELKQNMSTCYTEKFFKG